MSDWYYSENNEQRGPITLDALREMLGNGVVNQTTLVWKDGMGAWAPIGQIPEVMTTIATSSSFGAGQMIPQPMPMNTGHIDEPVSNYLWQNIVLLVLAGIGILSCCFPIFALPTAVIGLINSQTVNKHLMARNFELAKSESKKAKTMAIVSGSILGVSLLLYIGLAVGVIVFAGP